MYFFPFAVDSYRKRPCTFNYLIIAINIILFMLVFFNYLPQEPFILNQTDGFITHGFMHADWIHLIGNMFYLLLFGNVLCSHIGGLKYVLLYFCFMIGAAVMHVIVDGDPALGASGAISGVLGMVFLLAPGAKVRTIEEYSYMRNELFPEMKIPAQWVIGTWFFLRCLRRHVWSLPYCLHGPYRRLPHRAFTGLVWHQDGMAGSAARI